MKQFITIIFVGVCFIAMAASRAAEPASPTEPAVTPAAPVAPAEAATETATSEAHGLPQSAQALGIGKGFITNSMLVTWIVALGIIGFARVATRRMQEVPSGAQNLAESVVEGLYNFLEGVIGPELVKKTFWFFSTIFIFILATNWFGLIPGVGTIGWGVPVTGGFEVTRPLLRGGNADLNITFAMAMIFMVLWLVWAIQSSGVKGFLLHLFGPKGESPSAIKYVMILLFFLVGLLEVISIAFRPVSLSFRLYGNIFAGENLLEAMASMVKQPAWARSVFAVLLPLPFYFMELLVGFVQALVFMLLTAVFTGTICAHDEESEKAQH